MTVEELKAEAKKLGYNVVPIRQSIRFEPCPCGRKYPDLWWIAGYSTNNNEVAFYKCPKCDREAPAGKNKQDAKIKWNEFVKELK